MQEAEQKYIQCIPKLETRNDNNICNNPPVLKSKKEQEKYEQPNQEEKSKQEKDKSRGEIF